MTPQQSFASKPISGTAFLTAWKRRWRQRLACRPRQYQTDNKTKYCIAKTLITPTGGSEPRIFPSEFHKVARWSLPASSPALTSCTETNYPLPSARIRSAGGHVEEHALRFSVACNSDEFSISTPAYSTAKYKSQQWIEITQSFLE